MTPAAEHIAAEIRRTGPIPFARFMALALYGPGGYYRKIRTGKSGDFITSVSIGPCFGDLLADQVSLCWQELGSPPAFCLIEQGASDGALMQDVLTALQVRHPACLQAAAVHLIEPLTELSALQQQTLAKWGSRIRWQADWASLRAENAVFFCNELLDAFPVHRVRSRRGAWCELAVTLSPEANSFVWVELPLTSPFLQEAASRLPARPDGFTTELSPGAADWLREMSPAIRRGHALLFDYGLTREDYHAPGRSSGTLRGYRAHRQTTDLLADPGETDLTAHVNWTEVTESAAALGWIPSPLADQARFLTALAAPRLQSMEGRPPSRVELAWLRQFQTLTHPSHLGQRFQVLHLKKSG